MKRQRSIIHRAFPAGISAIYFFTNVAAVHASESTFWAERRRASFQKVQGGENISIGRISNNPNSQMVLAQLPHASPMELGGSLPPPFSTGTNGTKEPFSLGPKTGDWLGKLVMPYGSVNDVFISPKPDAPFIVHIQDAHGIEEAQRNIASMIELLGQEPGIQLVGLEGAAGHFSLAPYREFPTPAVTKDVAEFFLKKGLIAGPEYAGLTMSNSPQFFGAENNDLYLANVQALKTGFKGKEGAQTTFNDLQSETEKLKETLYSKSLTTFDRHFESYHADKEKLADYVRYLLVNIPSLSARPSVPNLHLLVNALDEENALDFKRVETERKQLIDRLVETLSKADLQDLVDKSVDYRAGRMGYGDYHAHLRKICLDHKIALSDFPQLARYISYVFLADKIDRKGLLNEMDLMEQALPISLTKSADEKKLVSLARDLVLLNKLLRHEMTMADWTTYQTRREDIYRFGARLAELNPTRAMSTAFTKETLKPFEDFCSYAVQRNTALTNNFSRQMTQGKTKSGILVAGGFHTEGLSALLRQRQISYVVVTPKITNVLTDNNYLDILAKDPVPLEQLLAGDRIYLSQRIALGQTDSQVAQAVRALSTLLNGRMGHYVKVFNKYAFTTAPPAPADIIGKLVFGGFTIYFVKSYRAGSTLLRWAAVVVNKANDFKNSVPAWLAQHHQWEAFAASGMALGFSLFHVSIAVLTGVAVALVFLHLWLSHNNDYELYQDRLIRNSKTPMKKSTWILFYFGSGLLAIPLIFLAYSSPVILDRFLDSQLSFTPLALATGFMSVLTYQFLHAPWDRRASQNRITMSAVIFRVREQPLSESTPIDPFLANSVPSWIVTEFRNMKTRQTLLDRLIEKIQKNPDLEPEAIQFINLFSMHGTDERIVELENKTLPANPGPFEMAQVVRTSLQRLSQTKSRRSFLKSAFSFVAKGITPHWTTVLVKPENPLQLLNTGFAGFEDVGTGESFASGPTGSELNPEEMKIAFEAEMKGRLKFLIDGIVSTIRGTRDGQSIGHEEIRKTVLETLKKIGAKYISGQSVITEGNAIDTAREFASGTWIPSIMRQLFPADDLIVSSSGGTSLPTPSHKVSPVENPTISGPPGLTSLPTTPQISRPHLPEVRKLMEGSYPPLTKPLQHEIARFEVTNGGDRFVISHWKSASPDMDQIVYEFIKILEFKRNERVIPIPQGPYGVWEFIAQRNGERSIQINSERMFGIPHPAGEKPYFAGSALMAVMLKNVAGLNVPIVGVLAEKNAEALEKEILRSRGESRPLTFKDLQNIPAFRDPECGYRLRIDENGVARYKKIWLGPNFKSRLDEESIQQLSDQKNFDVFLQLQNQIREELAEGSPAAAIPGVVRFIRIVMVSLVKLFPKSGWAREWKTLSRQGKLDRTIRVYAPFVESFFMGVAYWGITLLAQVALPMVGLDPGLLSNASILSVLNVIFGMLHTEVYRKNSVTGNWERRPATPGTQMGIAVIGLAFHSPLLLSTLYPFLAPLALIGGNIAAALLSGLLHRMYNDLVVPRFGNHTVSKIAKDAVLNTLAEQLRTNLLGSSALNLKLRELTKSLSPRINQMERGDISEERLIENLKIIQNDQSARPVLLDVKNQLRDKTSSLIARMFEFAGARWAELGSGPMAIAMHDLEDWRGNANYVSFIRGAVGSAAKSNRKIVIAAFPAQQATARSIFQLPANTTFREQEIHGHTLDAGEFAKAAETKTLLAANAKRIENTSGLDLFYLETISRAIAREIEWLDKVMEQA